MEAAIRAAGLLDSGAFNLRAEASIRHRFSESGAAFLRGSATTEQEWEVLAGLNYVW